MKHALILCLGLAFAGAPASARAQRIDVNERPIRAERTHDFDILHYRIELRIDPARRVFEGQTRVRAKSLQRNVGRLDLDAETFSVLSVADGDGAPLAFTHANGTLSITLGRKLRKGAQTDVVIAYRAENPVVDASAYGFNPGADLGLVFQPATATNPALVNTQSFPEGARHWFPSFDHPGDPAAHDTIITAPADFQVVANGRLVSVADAPEEGWRTFHWSQEKPHPTYLYVVAAGPYVEIDSGVTAFPVRYWVYPDAATIAPVAFGATPKILDFFSDAYGAPFPWVKYDQITVPKITGGAESTSATIIGDINMFDPSAYDDFSIDWLIAHEAAHQYWGDLVSYRDWPHMWISESFATHSEVLYDEHALGADAAALRLQQKKDEYLREAREKYVRPIYFERWNYPNDLFDRHSYHKGAVVLHMLRDYVGREKFREMMARFLNKHAYQPVTTADFIATAREVAGEDLGWFFDQWLFSPGHPVFAVSYAWSEERGEVRLKVDQTQDASGGVPAAFKTPVKIRIATASGAQTFDVAIDGRSETFDLPSKDRPLMVKFDADDVLLKELSFAKGVDELIYQLNADGVIGAAWAARELGAGAREAKALEALSLAAETHSAWSVRMAAIEAMGPPRDSTMLKRLMAVAGADESARVRAAAFAAMQGTRDKAAVAFARQAYAGDRSYLVKAAALKVLGATGDAQWKELIEEARARPSPRLVLKRAAEVALALLNTN